MKVVVLGSYVRGYCLAVPNLPVSGASVQANAGWQIHGGKGLTLAVGIHRLGLKVSLLLAIGKDESGAAIYKYLQAEGLSTNNVLTLGEQSGFAVGLIGADGKNVIAIYSGANHQLNESHVLALEDDICQAKLVCAQFEIQPEIVLTAFRLAKRYQVKTLLNPSPWQQPSAELLNLTDILILNEVEALAMFGIDASVLSVAEWFELDLKPYWQGELLIITLAERGSILFNREQQPVHVAAWPINQVDPTSAGDAFAAGFTYALTQAHSHPQALNFANACGALLAQQAEVLEALPKLSTVEAFMKQNYYPH
ncbi:MAG: ribokinase [Thiolinea sp.]